MVAEITDMYGDDMGHQSAKPDIGEVGVFCRVCHRWSDGQSDLCHHCLERLLGSRPLSKDSVAVWVGGQVDEHRALGIPVPAEDQDLLHRWAAFDSTDTQVPAETSGQSGDLVKAGTQRDMIEELMARDGISWRQAWKQSGAQPEPPDPAPRRQQRLLGWRAKVFGAISIALGVIVVVISWPGWPVSVDNPVGTLQLDELSVAFATDPDGEAERIVGEVWRIEGPKKAYTRFETLELFADVGTDDRGVTTALLPTFVDEWDEFRFKTRVIPIACRIVKVDGPPAVQYLTLYAPFRIGDERWIEADSCLVIDPAKSQ
jgi:hypothetical protein